MPAPAGDQRVELARCGGVVGEDQYGPAGVVEVREYGAVEPGAFVEGGRDVDRVHAQCAQQCFQRLVGGDGVGVVASGG